MRKKLLWLAAATLLLPIFPFNIVYATAENTVEKTEESQSVEESVETEEDIEEAIPPIIEKENLNNHVQEESQNTEIEDKTDPKVIDVMINEPFDDNTLTLEGHTDPGLTVILKKTDKSKINQVISNSSGYFIFRFNQPFKAGTQLLVETFQETDKVASQMVTVESGGLHIDEPIMNTSLSIKGTTSPLKTAELVYLDQIIATTSTNEAGEFEFNLAEPFEQDSAVIIRVYDDERIAREITLAVQEAAGSDLTVPSIDSVLTDQMLEIKGTADKNVWIDLRDESGTTLDTVQTNSNGEFNFTLEEAFVKDTILTFQARSEIAVSPKVELIVEEEIGNLKTNSINALSQISASNLINVTVDDTMTTVQGTYNRARLNELIADKLPTLGSLRYVELNLKDASGNSYGTVPLRLNTNSNQFTFNLNRPVPAGTQINFEFIMYYRVLLIFSDSRSIATESISVQGNRLEFQTQPPDITFGETMIKNSNEIIYRKQPVNYTFSVYNSRPQKWDLLLVANRPLSNRNGHALNDVLYLKKGNSMTPIEGMAVNVTKHTPPIQEPSNRFISSFRWGGQDGIVADINPLEAEPNTSYSTNVQWTLQNAPQ